MVRNRTKIERLRDKKRKRETRFKKLRGNMSKRKARS